MKRLFSLLVLLVSTATVAHAEAPCQVEPATSAWINEAYNSLDKIAIDDIPALRVIPALKMDICIGSNLTDASIQTLAEEIHLQALLPFYNLQSLFEVVLAEQQ